MSKVTCGIVAAVVLVSVLVCGVASAAVLGIFAYADGGLDHQSSLRSTSVSEVAVDSPATLNVRNRVGNVTVRGSRGVNTIQVEATTEVNSVLGSRAEALLRETDVRIEGRGSHARVDVDLPEESRIEFVRVNLLITVPEGIDLSVVNQAGHIQVEGTAGDIQVRSETGNVRLEGVTVTQRCDVVNTAGNIVFEGRLPEPGAYEEPWEVLLRTETGNISFATPADSLFTLDAESETGSVDSELGLDGLRSGDVDALGEWLKGSAGGSEVGANVILRTETGNITIAPSR